MVVFDVAAIGATFIGAVILGVAIGVGTALAVNR